MELTEVKDAELNLLFSEWKCWFLLIFQKEKRVSYHFILRISETHLLKNEPLHARGSKSSCLANSKMNCMQMTWWATWSISSSFYKVTNHTNESRFSPSRMFRCTNFHTEWDIGFSRPNMNWILSSFVVGEAFTFILKSQ
jgi:hypothetical protein